ncbi:MAG TPA: TetR/AcrR family transcriptional regulator [Phycisphaerae bacterium]|mgnify:CR=1 FL=1|nr:TetR/AcrR family transcriptional regulator [Phycisphaerae bacterium]
METRHKQTGSQTRKRDPQASRRLLLEAAIDVFGRSGPEAASVDDICRRAGLNKRMVYHYFGSKEGLYREALRTVYDEFAGVEIALAHMLLPPEELLETLVRRYHAFLAEHPESVRLISFENLHGGRVARQLALEGKKAQIATALQLALQKGQAERRFREGIDATELLVSIFSLCFFYFSNQYTMGQFLGLDSLAHRTDMESHIRHVVSLLLHGIARRGTA